MSKHSIEAIDQFEIGQGVYILYDQDEIVYIGQTKQIGSRLRNHQLSNKIFDSYIFIPCKGQARNRKEAKLIYKYLPIYNKTIPIQYLKGVMKLSGMKITNSCHKEYTISLRTINHNVYLDFSDTNIVCMPEIEYKQLKEFEYDRLHACDEIYDKKQK